MESTRIQNGQTERIEVVMTDGGGDPLTGLSDVLLLVRRVSDGKFLDFDDNTFKAAGWTDIDQVMSEVDATNAAGTYSYDFDTSGFSDDVYEMRVTCASAVNVPQVGELKVGDVMDMIAIGSYQEGIWLDSGASNTTTVIGVDGVPNNPVSTLAAAKTLADAIGVQKYYLTNGSAFTLAATHEWWEFVGKGRAANILNLGSQDVDNSSFFNLSLTGTQGGSTFIKLEKCNMTTLLALRPQAIDCCVAGDVTILTGTMLSFVNCFSGVPGDTTPELTFSSGVTTLQFRDYSGGAQFNSMTADHTLSFETDGQIIFDASCTGGNASLRGMMSITDNASGVVTITKDAVYNKSEVLDALVDDATQYSGMDVTLIRQLLHNKLTFDRINSLLQLWNDAGTDVIYTWKLTDIDDLNVVITSTDPVNRAKPITL